MGEVWAFGKVHTKIYNFDLLTTDKYPSNTRIIVYNVLCDTQQTVKLKTAESADLLNQQISMNYVRIIFNFCFCAGT